MHTNRRARTAVSNNTTFLRQTAVERGLSHDSWRLCQRTSDRQATLVGSVSRDDLEFKVKPKRRIRKTRSCARVCPRLRLVTRVPEKYEYVFIFSYFDSELRREEFRGFILMCVFVCGCGLFFILFSSTSL